MTFKLWLSFLRWTSVLGLVLAMAYGPAALADKDFSSWRKFSQGELIAETTALTPGSSGTVGLHIRLEKDWHTYWVNPGDSGTPLNLKFKNSPGIKVKSVLQPVPERIEAGGLVTFGYSREVLFLIEVDVSPSMTLGKDASFEVDAEWLVCKDVCIPAFDNLKLNVPVLALGEVQPSATFELFQRARGALPQIKDPFPQWSKDGDQVRLVVENWEQREFKDFFAFKNSGVTNTSPKASVQAGRLVLTFEPSAVPNESPARVGVLSLRNLRTGQNEAFQYGEPKWQFQEVSRAPPQDFWWMLISAFIGGLILNLMPCVFPILSMKLLSLLKLASAHADEVRKQNLAYVAGVLVSFLVIALLLSMLRSAGSLIGWGFQLQSPVFLSVLCWLFFVLGLNLLGVFEIEFLNSGMGGRWTRQKGLWGSFFTGILAVVVASPCTAPFMGVALGFGLTQTIPILFAVFLTLGLGLAFPYLVFAIFPQSIRVLPKPGRWMTIVKQIMALPLFLTLLWLLWLLGQVRGTHAIMVVLSGCVALGFVFWFTAWRKKVAKIIATFVIIGGLVYVYRSEQVVQSHVQSEVWKNYSENLLDSLKGQRVFVNMTADWCLTCKVNERLIFDDPEVMKLLESKQVVLIKGDWTQRNEEITRYLARFDRVGVPFYVLYSPQHPTGLVLPEVLTKSSFMEMIQKEFP